MLGLIKKDFFLIKSNLRSTAIILIVYLIMAIKGSFDMNLVLPLFGMILLISTFNYDEYNNWYAYATALPTGRKSIVQAKYLLALIMLVVTWIIGILVSILSNKNSLDIKEIFASITGFTLGIVILITLLYPFLFKYGAEKGRIAIFVFLFGVMLVVTICSKYIDFTFLNSFFHLLGQHLYLIPIFSIILLFFSYKISEKIILKKEF